VGIDELLSFLYRIWWYRRTSGKDIPKLNGQCGHVVEIQMIKSIVPNYPLANKLFYDNILIKEGLWI